MDSISTLQLKGKCNEKSNDSSTPSDTENYEKTTLNGKQNEDLEVTNIKGGKDKITNKEQASFNANSKSKNKKSFDNNDSKNIDSNSNSELTNGLQCLNLFERSVQDPFSQDCDIEDEVTLRSLSNVRNLTLNDINDLTNDNNIISSQTNYDKPEINQNNLGDTTNENFDKLFWNNPFKNGDTTTKRKPMKINSIKASNSGNCNDFPNKNYLKETRTLPSLKRNASVTRKHITSMISPLSRRRANSSSLIQQFANTTSSTNNINSNSNSNNNNNNIINSLPITHHNSMSLNNFNNNEINLDNGNNCLNENTNDFDIFTSLKRTGSSSTSSNNSFRPILSSHSSRSSFLTHLCGLEKYISTDLDALSNGEYLKSVYDKSYSNSPNEPYKKLGNSEKESDQNNSMVNSDDISSIDKFDNIDNIDNDYTVKSSKDATPLNDITNLHSGYSNDFMQNYKSESRLSNFYDVKNGDNKSSSSNKDFKNDSNNILPYYNRRKSFIEKSLANSFAP